MITPPPLQFEQPCVSRVIWPWVAAKAPPAAPPSCRRRAVIQFAAMLAIAGLLALRSQHAALTVLGVALFVISTGLFAPRVFLAVERAFKHFGHGVGIALTWALLVPFFLLVFVPGRLMLLLSGKDPLTRAFPGDEKTNWVPHTVRADNDHYTKQYK